VYKLVQKSNGALGKSNGAARSAPSRRRRRHQNAPQAIFFWDALRYRYKRDFHKEPHFYVNYE
jgi:hypothetical protein